MDKAIIKPSCYEISHQKLLFLGDMDDCISRLTNVHKVFQDLVTFMTCGQ